MVRPVCHSSWTPTALSNDDEIMTALSRTRINLIIEVALAVNVMPALKPRRKAFLSPGPATHPTLPCPRARGGYIPHSPLCPRPEPPIYEHRRMAARVPGSTDPVYSRPMANEPP